MVDRGLYTWHLHAQTLGKQKVTSYNLSNIFLRWHTQKVYPKGCVLFPEQNALLFDLKTVVGNGNGRNCYCTAVILISLSSLGTVPTRLISKVAKRLWVDRHESSQSKFYPCHLGEEMQQSVWGYCFLWSISNWSNQLIIDRPAQ